jgi:hypothetical protein
MSKKQLTITDEVMEKIHGKQIRMRPKIYYFFGSLLVLGSLIFSVVSSVFLISLTRFALKTHGPMGQIRLEQLLSSFPWWAPLLAVVGLIAGIWIMRKYDFSYKFNFPMIIVGFILAVVIAGWTIDYLNLDNIWFRQGPMRGIMRQYMQNNGLQPRHGLNGKTNIFVR